MSTLLCVALCALLIVVTTRALLKRRYTHTVEKQASLRTLTVRVVRYQDGHVWFYVPGHQHGAAYMGEHTLTL